MGAWYSPGILPMVYSGFPDDEETKKMSHPINYRGGPKKNFFSGFPLDLLTY